MRKIVVATGLAGLLGAWFWATPPHQPPFATQPTAGNRLLTGPAVVPQPTVTPALPIQTAAPPPVVIDAQTPPRRSGGQRTAANAGSPEAGVAWHAPPNIPQGRLAPIAPIAPGRPPERAAVVPLANGEAALPAAALRNPRDSTAEAVQKPSRTIMPPKNGDVPGQLSQQAPAKSGAGGGQGKSAIAMVPPGLNRMQAQTKETKPFSPPQQTKAPKRDATIRPVSAFDRVTSTRSPTRPVGSRMTWSGAPPPPLRAVTAMVAVSPRLSPMPRVAPAARVVFNPP